MLKNKAMVGCSVNYHLQGVQHCGTMLFDAYYSKDDIACQVLICSIYKIFYRRNEIMAKLLGGKIRDLRQQKGFSLDQLADKTGTSKSYIWELENRDTRKPSAEKLTKIAETLEVTIDYLLDDSPTPNEDVLKEAFFRKFKKLEDSDKEKIEQLIDLWGKNE